MEESALLHRPESEYAYLYTKDVMHIRFRTKKNDVKQVSLVCGDPYLFDEEKWYETVKQPLSLIASTAVHDYWQTSVSATYNRLSYLFIVEDNEQNQVLFSDQGVIPFTEINLKQQSYYFKMPYFQEIDRVKVPEWVKETVWYQIFPERFANGNPKLSPENSLAWDEGSPTRTNFYGGDLQGILDHLDYLQDLGINGLYLCPIFEASTNHKYDTIDYFEIDKHFGDKKIFKQLVDQAHKRGMKIMLDAVFNHIGTWSKEWQDVVKNQEKSRYANWFHINAFPVGNEEITDIENTKNLNYETFAFSAHMPKLNTANPEVIAHLLKIATYWIEEFHIDAWRLDVANEVDHQFWKKFYAKTLALKPDLYILGEIWHSSQNWLNGDEFHAVMNYAFTDSINSCFITQTIDAKQMISQLTYQMMRYRQQTTEVMFNLLDSHDTPRVLTCAKGDKQRVKAALAFMFMQLGTPCIYYGTEIGMTGGPDPDNRKPMWWDKTKQDLEMFDFMQQLIQFKKDNNTCLASGSVMFEIIPNTEVIKVTRLQAKQKIVGYFNTSEQTFDLDVTAPSLFKQQAKINQLSAYEFYIMEEL